MNYRLLADLSVVAHFLFILFAAAGSLLSWRWPRLAWLQIPAALWGGYIEISGSFCPLTTLENYFREQGGLAGYEESFIDHYLLPLVYPEILFPQGIPRLFFIGIGVLTLAFNAGIYLALFMKIHRERTRPDPPEDFPDRCA